jgi:hypothetical protein
MEGEKKSIDSRRVDQKDGGNTGNFFVNQENTSSNGDQSLLPVHRNEKIIVWVIVAVGILALVLVVKSFSDNIFYPTWLRLDKSAILVDDSSQSNASNPLDLLNNDSSNGSSFAPQVSTTMDGVPQQGLSPDVSSLDMTAAQLRQAMLDSGMAKTDVDKMTDQQIEALYQKAQAAATDSTANPTSGDDLLNTVGYTSSTANTGSNQITSLDQLKAMPISQFRQLLLSSPDLTATNRDILNKMSDADLQKLLNQQLASTTNAN